MIYLLVRYEIGISMQSNLDIQTFKVLFTKNSHSFQISKYIENIESSFQF